MLKIIFISISVILFTMFILGKIFVFGKQKPAFVGVYAAILSVWLALYSLSALTLLFTGGLFDKVAMLVFAVSPFIIGKLTNYKTVELYTFVQLAVVVLSAVFVFFRF